jgi:transcriptional regulator with XRE-family HTH domain
MPEKLIRSPRWTELERLRLDAGLDCASLGRKAGLSQAAVWRIENGVRTGSPDAVRRIAAVFGMSTTELEATRPTSSPSPSDELADVA